MLLVTEFWLETKYACVRASMCTLLPFTAAALKMLALISPLCLSDVCCVRSVLELQDVRAAL